jgi:hypothetical protein
MMATRRPMLVLLYLQLRRRYTCYRLLRTLNWRKPWDRTVSARQYLDGLRR